MGYSKWRKILTILMVISICFTLFSKVSKVYANIEGDSTPIVVYGTEYDLYYKFISDYYNNYILCAVQEYSGNTIGYNRLYLYASDNEMIYNTYAYNYSNGTYIEHITFDPTNNDTISYFIGDKPSYYNNRFNFSDTVTYFNNANFIPNASSGYHSISNTAFQYNNQTTTPIFRNGDYNNNYYKDTCVILDANYDVKDNNNNIVFYSNSRRPPELATSQSDLENLNFEGLSINSWGYSDINFYLLIYDRTIIGDDYEYVLNPAREILINKNSSYYQPSLTADPDSNCVYFVPITDIGLQFQKNGIYEIRFGIKQYYNERRRTAEEVEDGRGGASDDPTPTEFVDPEDIYSDTDSSGTGAGGGFSSRPYYYTYIGDLYAWELSPDVSQAKIDSINNSIVLTNEQRRHYELISLLEEILNGTIGKQEDSYIRSGIISENNQDITANGFNGIFTRLYNSITSTPQKVSLTIPFTNTPMEIDPQSTYNGLGENNALLNFYQLSILAAVSLFILKDIVKTIQDIKTGDIATKTDTNIKANML